jgi:uncharacterized protein (DUF1499 family)
MFQHRAPKITLMTTGLLSALGLFTSPAPAAETMQFDARINCILPTNCVNSRTSSGLAPLHFTGSGAQGMALLKATLASFPEANVQEEDENTVTAVFTTPVGFRDNVIFVLDPQQQQIDFRSQSGFGLFDFGKNRSRMEAFTARYAEVAAAPDSK